MNTYRLRIFIVLILSFFISSFLDSQVFLSHSPQVNPKAVVALFSFPSTIKTASAKLFAQKPKKYVSQSSFSSSSMSSYIKPPSSNIPTKSQEPIVSIDLRKPTVTPYGLKVPTPTVAIVPTIPIITEPTIIEPTQEPQVIEEPEPTRAVIPTTAPVTSRPQSLAEWGTCLTNHGMVMYYTQTCAKCSHEKSVLGAAFKNITSVNCSREAGTCVSVGIRGVPSWAKNGSLVNVSTEDDEILVSLAEVSGCPLPN